MADKPAAADSAKKVDPRVEALKKNHFWILAGIVFVTALAVWWLGTGALADQYKKDEGTNNRAFTSLLPYKAPGENSPPNQHYKTAVNKQNDEVGKEVVETWKALFDHQETILTYNERVGKTLGSMVLMDINERKQLFNSSNEVGTQISLDIQNFHNGQVIETEFNKLFDMLNLRRTKPVAAGAAGAAVPAPVANPLAPAGGGNQGPVEGVVVWFAPRSTQQLMQRYRTTKAPTYNRYCVTQEDIWIFKSIFGVIQSINKYSNDNWLQVLNGNPLPTEPPLIDQANVPIKRIDFCDVAQYAMNKAFDDPGRINPIGKEKNDDAMFSNSGGAGNFNVGTTGDPSEDETLLKDRYLDGRNFPVADPASPPISEFRQVFLQLTVLMDQRLVPILISECAQAPFPIETRQVRMTLMDVDVPQQKNAQAGGISRVETSPHDVTVNLRGVVYIYLKPDQKKLGKGTDKEPGKREYGIPQQSPSEATPGL